MAASGMTSSHGPFDLVLLTLILSLYLHNAAIGDEAFPSMPSRASFSGPIDVTTYRLKDELPWLQNGQAKACCFVRLAGYLQPANEDMPPYKGQHPFHIFILFPLNQQPWQSICKWMMTATGRGPFTPKSWLCGTGPVVGILNRKAIEGFPESDTDTTILVVIPETWEFVTRTTLEPPPPVSVSQATTPRSESATTAGPGSGRVSRNPFASPRTSETTPSTPPSARNTLTAPGQVLAQSDPPPSPTPTRGSRVSVPAPAIRPTPPPGTSTIPRSPPSAYSPFENVLMT